MTCVFCQIIERKLPASFVYEDEHTVAYLDIHPLAEGHVLVIPKRHEAQFANLTDDEASRLFVVGRKILKAIQESEIKCEGANLFLSDGRAAGQEVMHSHLHILPRFSGDGQRVGFSPLDPEAGERAKLNHIASQIAKQIAKYAEVEVARKT